jgi:hypothetical protein
LQEVKKNSIHILETDYSVIPKHRQLYSKMTAEFKKRAQGIFYGKNGRKIVR